MNTNILQFDCMVAVSQMLDFIRNFQPRNDLDASHESMNLPEGEYVFWYTYRLDFPLVKKVHKVSPQDSPFDILKIAAIDFEDIFGLVDPLKGTSSVHPSMCPGEMHMTNYGDLFGGAHAIISTPWFEGIDIDTDKRSISFSMGT